VTRTHAAQQRFQGKGSRHVRALAARVAAFMSARLHFTTQTHKPRVIFNQCNRTTHIQWFSPLNTHLLACITAKHTPPRVQQHKSEHTLTSRRVLQNEHLNEDSSSRGNHRNQRWTHLRAGHAQCVPGDARGGACALCAARRAVARAARDGEL